MKKNLRKMKEQIEKRGGRVYVNDELPDEIAEMFLKEILDCPDCRAAARENGNRRGLGRRSDH